jgi:hypothetical protein
MSAPPLLLQPLLSQPLLPPAPAPHHADSPPGLRPLHSHPQVYSNPIVRAVRLSLPENCSNTVTCFHCFCFICLVCKACLSPPSWFPSSLQLITITTITAQPGWARARQPTTAGTVSRLSSSSNQIELCYILLIRNHKWHGRSACRAYRSSFGSVLGNSLPRS